MRMRFLRRCSLLLSVLPACAGFTPASASLMSWMERPVIRECLRRYEAKQAASRLPAPDGSEPMAISSASPEAQHAVLEGMVHLLSFGDRRAYLSFSKALEADPDCLMAHWGLCMSLLGADPSFREQSVASLQKMQGLAISSDFPERERAYAESLIRLLTEGTKEACRAWENITERWPKDPYAPLFYAMMVRDGYDGDGVPGSGQLKALQVTDQQLERMPESFTALFLRALLEETAPEISDTALTCARKAAEVNPQSASAHQVLGHCLFRRGEYREAADEFQRAEELSLAWEQESRQPHAMNDGYYRAAVYRAVALFCQGQTKRAAEVARKLAQDVPEKDYPMAPGTTLWLWEARSLPMRLRLSESKRVPQASILNEVPASQAQEFPELSQGVTAIQLQYMSALTAAERHDFAALNASFERLSGVVKLLLDGGKEARRQMSLSYWNRALQLASSYGMEIRAMMFEDTAQVWLDHAIRDQRPASLLLPPVLPYPEEWMAARYFLNKKQYEESAQWCQEAFKRFPNHALVLQTAAEVNKKLSTQSVPSSTTTSS